MNSSKRLQHWDYSNPGLYFITICTKNRIPFFGTVIDGEVELTPIGQQLQKEWNMSAELRKDQCIQMDLITIMPNHLHGIIRIESDDQATGKELEGFRNRFGPQSKNISSIIRGLKSSVSSWAKKNQINFAWQGGFHDRVIRDEKELNRIIDYIQNNPMRYDEKRRSNDFFHSLK